MLQELSRIATIRQLILQGTRQVNSLGARVLDPALQEYLEGARVCLDEAQDLIEALEGQNASPAHRRQALLAAETILAVSNRQIRLLLVRLLDLYGPGVVSLN